MSMQDNVKIARNNYDAYNQRDFDRSAAQLAEDAELFNVPLGMSMRGREGFRQFFQSWATAFPDSTIEILNIVADEAGAVVEFHGRGTHTGPLVSPAGEIPATGRSVDLHFCDVMQIKDGKVTSVRTYYDTATMMRQLGLIS